MRRPMNSRGKAMQLAAMDSRGEAIRLAVMDSRGKAMRLAAMDSRGNAIRLAAMDSRGKATRLATMDSRGEAMRLAAMNSRVEAIRLATMDSRVEAIRLANLCGCPKKWQKNTPASAGIHTLFFFLCQSFRSVFPIPTIPVFHGFSALSMAALFSCRSVVNRSGLPWVSKIVSSF